MKKFNREIVILTILLVIAVARISFTGIRDSVASWLYADSFIIVRNNKFPVTYTLEKVKSVPAFVPNFEIKCSRGKCRVVFK